jgi:hypothetical protein
MGLDINNEHWEPCADDHLGASIGAVRKVKGGKIDGIWWSSSAYIEY